MKMSKSIMDNFGPGLDQPAYLDTSSNEESSNSEMGEDDIIYRVYCEVQCFTTSQDISSHVPLFLAYKASKAITRQDDTR